MIRRGRKDGWLEMPLTAFQSWTEFDGATYDGVKFGSIHGRGSGIVATRELIGGQTVITIPRELLLSLEGVHVLAKADKRLGQLIEVLGDFTRTARGAILMFLLHQATIADPRVEESVGLPNQFSNYIKVLPQESLPTFWSNAERQLLAGTSLHPALTAKMNSLQKEFENVRSMTAEIPWCSKHWWGAEYGLLSFDDWLQVDAMYRSRALEFPGIGDAMIPCIDMANHAAGDQTAALYETDGQGNAILLLRDGFKVEADQEVTITYGDEKGACEMIFSYGFLERMDSAKQLFLDLQVPADDPLGMAKVKVSRSAPGVKLIDSSDGVKWLSDFIWLICVNEEDGLKFCILQTNDGDQELKAFWKDAELSKPWDFHDILQQDALWEVHELRAVALVQERIEKQLKEIARSPSRDFAIQHSEDVRDGPRHLALMLRTLEENFLERAWASLEQEKNDLIVTDVVQKYLSAAADRGSEEEDFT